MLSLDAGHRDCWIVRTTWFTYAFPDLASAVAKGQLQSSRALADACQRLRIRLLGYLTRRRIKSALKHADEVEQRFWVRMIESRVFQKYDPSKGTPWPMVYLLFRYAAWDVLQDQQGSPGKAIALCEEARRDDRFEAFDLREALRQHSEQLTAIQRAAIDNRYPGALGPDTWGASLPLNNEAVIRCRAIAELRDAMSATSR